LSKHFRREGVRGTSDNGKRLSIKVKGFAGKGEQPSMNPVREKLNPEAILGGAAGINGRPLKDVFS